MEITWGAGRGIRVRYVALDRQFQGTRDRRFPGGRPGDGGLPANVVHDAADDHLDPDRGEDQAHHLDRDPHPELAETALDRGGGEQKDQDDEGCDHDRGDVRRHVVPGRMRVIGEEDGDRDRSGAGDQRDSERHDGRIVIAAGRHLDAVIGAGPDHGYRDHHGEEAARHAEDVGRDGEEGEDSLAEPRRDDQRDQNRGAGDEGDADAPGAGVARRQRQHQRNGGERVEERDHRADILDEFVDLEAIHVACPYPESEQRQISLRSSISHVSSAIES